MNPEQHSLERLNWQVFATLTFSSESRSENERKRSSCLFAWLRYAASKTGVHFARLLWVVRLERGEHGARIHFHVVMGGMPGNVGDGLRFALKHFWEGGLDKNNMPQRWGFADVRRWDKGRRALDYILKPGFELKAANAYEVQRFGGIRSQVTLSKSVVRALARLDAGI